MKTIVRCSHSLIMMINVVFYLINDNNSDEFRSLKIIPKDMHYTNISLLISPPPHIPLLSLNRATYFMLMRIADATVHLMMINIPQISSI